MWTEPQKKESEQERRGDLFFTLSAQFPLYFLPEDPCLQNVQSVLSMDRRPWNLPEQKNMKKEERNAPPPLFLNCNRERWSYYPENLTTFFFFFHFLSRSSRNTELLLRPEYLDRTPFTRSDVKREEKKLMLHMAKSIGLYFCPASRLIGVHVRQPIADGLKFKCGEKY